MTLLQRLAEHRALGAVPVAEHEWLVRHGTLLQIAAGEILTRKGELAPTLSVFLTGHVAIHGDRGAGSHKIFEWHGGDVGGALPFSRGARAPNDAIAQEPTEYLAVPKEDLAEMIRECPAVTAILVHVMVDRARQFNASDLLDEKLVSLGKLAAGLAHELNNPASAAKRSAHLLGEGLRSADAAAAVVWTAHLSDEQLRAIESVRARCNTAPDVPQSALARADREDEIAEWLTAHGADDECAAQLAETALKLDTLDELAAQLSGATLAAAVKWIAAGCLVRTLASEIEMATSRVYDLVTSVKGFTYMDRTPTLEPVDIRRGVTDTLNMLGSKTRAKNAEVQLEFPDSLPRVRAIGAELNQVWMNLLDNALDAIGAGGHILVSATLERDRVVVRIVDDGPGIPSEISGRIFDPFFTTKEVGKGTGLGLDIVKRILRRNDGEIEVDSVPGRTEFRVSLRATQERGSAAWKMQDGVLTPL